MGETLADRIRAGSAPQFFDAPAGPEYLHPSLHETFIGDGGFAELQARRVQEQAERIRAELLAKGDPVVKSTRGGPREVVCLTMLDASGTRLKRYRTVSQAAKAVGQRCDNVSQAIRRSGTCSGHRYQYACDLPVEFNESAVVRRLRRDGVRPPRKLRYRDRRGGRAFQSRQMPRVARIANAGKGVRHGTSRLHRRSRGVVCGAAA